MDDTNTPDEPDDPIYDLSDAIREVISTYRQGHDIRTELVVGILHCIANEVIVDETIYFFDDDFDALDEGEEF